MNFDTALSTDKAILPTITYTETFNYHQPPQACGFMQHESDPLSLSSHYTVQASRVSLFTALQLTYYI